MFIGSVTIKPGPAESLCDWSGKNLLKLCSIKSRQLTTYGYTVLYPAVY